MVSRSTTNCISIKPRKKGGLSHLQTTTTFIMVIEIGSLMFPRFGRICGTIYVYYLERKHYVHIFEVISLVRYFSQM